MRIKRAYSIQYDRVQVKSDKTFAVIPHEEYNRELHKYLGKVKVGTALVTYAIPEEFLKEFEVNRDIEMYE